MSSIESILQEKGLDKLDFGFIKNLYWKQEAAVRVGQTTSAKVFIEKEVQGYVLSSFILFNVY